MQLRDVYSFSFNIDLFVFFNKNSKQIICLDKRLKNSWSYKFSNNAVVRVYNDKIYIADNYDEENILLDLEGKKIENLSESAISIDFHSSNLENRVKIFYGDSSLALYDLTTQKVIWTTSFKVNVDGILNPEMIFCVLKGGNKTIISLDINTGSLLWQFSVSELGKYTWSDGVKTHREEGKVERIIGVFGEVLVCVITGGGERVRGNTQLIGLDTSTGNLLWQIEQFIGTPNRQLPATATLMPDAQNKNLVGFQSGDFIEIDPQVGKVLRYSQINLVYEQHTLTGLMDSFSLQGDHLYFRSSVSSMGGFPTAIGAFNYKTETIEWLYVFEEFAKEGKFIPINQPKAEGNRVYALDSGNTLHIFEREY